MQEKTRQAEEALIRFEKEKSDELERREAINKQRAATNKRRNKRATRLLMFITCFACIHIFATVQYVFDHYVDYSAFSEMVLCGLIDFIVGFIFGIMAEYIERRINK